MTKLGLVFAGGGGKGAYEIGVWKALKEYGVDKSVTAISGTSVGGLNGALFAKGDFVQGEKVWREMSPKKILQVSPEGVAQFLSNFNMPANIAKTIGNKLGFLKSEGIFSQKGLESIIRDSLSEGDLKDKIPLYICATDVTEKTSWTPLYRQLNELEYEDIVQYLLATAAIPGAFGTIIQEDRELLDGFLTDNTPVKPLIELEECNKLIIVTLGRSENITKLKIEYPNVSMWEIVPTGDTKEMLGSLDFKTETAHRLIEMGYSDTLAILQNLYEFMLTEQEYLEKGKTLRVQEQGFKRLASNNALLRSEYKKIKEDHLQISSLQFLMEHSHSKEIPLISVQSETGTELIEVKLPDMPDMKLIESELEKTLEKMDGNSSEMTKFAFDAVTSLAATTGKISYQVNQGHFSRLVGGITGSNHKLQADINFSFSQAIHANTQMIKKLAERNNMTLDVCIALGNKVNYLAQNQNLLQEQNNEQLQMIGGLRNSIITLANASRNAIGNNTTRIEKLEYGQKLLFWSHNLKVELKELNSYDKTMKIVSGYYSITRGDNGDGGVFLHSVLMDNGLEDEHINIGSFVEYVIDKKDKDILLFDDIESSNFLPVPHSYEAHMPILGSINRVYEGSKEITLDKIALHFEERYNINFDATLNGVDFAFELLSGLNISGEIKRSLGEEKDYLLKQLDGLSKILENDKIDIFDKNIAKTKKSIDRFKIIIPIIGKFSSGKSKLLNRYLGTEGELFKVDTDPETAIATEIQYGSSDHIVLHENNTSKEIALESLNDANMQEVEYMQYFLDFPKLKHRKDLVLVDMPGFESGNSHHNDAINQYFNKGHHYILALSAESVNDGSILSHIKEIDSYGATFSIVITKSDKKMLRDIESSIKVLRENISRRYTKNDFFIGVTSANKKEFNDLEKIIDDVYEKSPLIFQKKYLKSVNNLADEIVIYYKKMIDMPNDLDELERKISDDKKYFEEDVKKLTSYLKGIKFKIVSDGSSTLITKTQNILQSNIAMLTSAAKSGELNARITDILRGPLNSTFKGISDDSLKEIEDLSIDTSDELHLSFAIDQPDTNLGIWDSIMNFFFDTQNKKIEEELRNNVIPNLVNNLSSNFKGQLEELYSSIEKLVEDKVVEKREKLESLNAEALEQMKLKTDEYEVLKCNQESSLEKIENIRRA